MGIFIWADIINWFEETLASCPCVNGFPSLKCTNWSWLSVPLDVFNDTLTIKQLSPVNHEIDCFAQNGVRK